MDPGGDGGAPKPKARFVKKGIDWDDRRRRMEGQALTIRKKKHEEQIAKRRHVSDLGDARANRARVSRGGRGKDRNGRRDCVQASDPFPVSPSLSSPPCSPSVSRPFPQAAAPELNSGAGAGAGTSGSASSPGSTPATGVS